MARLIIRHPLHLSERLRQLLLAPALGVDLEVPVVPDYDDVVEVGGVGQRYIRGRCGDSNGIETVPVRMKTRLPRANTYRYLYDAMQSGLPLTFSGSSNSLRPHQLSVTTKSKTDLSVSFLNSTVALTNSAALSSCFSPFPHPLVCT
jgi:hypothetical protein